MKILWRFTNAFIFSLHLDCHHCSHGKVNAVNDKGKLLFDVFDYLHSCLITQRKENTSIRKSHRGQFYSFFLFFIIIHVFVGSFFT